MPTASKDPLRFDRNKGYATKDHLHAVAQLATRSSALVRPRHILIVEGETGPRFRNFSSRLE